MAGFDDFKFTESRGDTIPLDFVCMQADQPVNLSGYKLWCIGKLAVADADNLALFLLTKENGGIVVTNESAGAATAIIQPEHSAMLSGETSVYVEIQIKSSTGVVSTVAGGTIVFVDDLVRSSS